jgi:NAD(P)-dependent dehydrogenase (short-subunit alcohol dehydrogenase family)
MSTAAAGGQRCLVTGGSRGLGRAICSELARGGARVAFTYGHNDDDAREATAQLAALGCDPLVFKGSVADAAHVRSTVAEVEARWGGIDVLVNNAGVTQVLPIALLEEADWDLVMDVNVKGAYLFSRAVLRAMIKARRGRILNIGSFGSERIIEAPIHFAAAKSALRGLTEAMAREVGRYGIQVNMLCPGLLDTGLGVMLPRARVDEYLSKCPLGRLGTAAEVARVAAFMVSDRNGFMAGAKVVADGGL